MGDKVRVSSLDLLLGEKDKAMRLLLETPASHSKFYPDMLKACVIAASHSQESFQQTVVPDDPFLTKSSRSHIRASPLPQVGEVARNMVASGWLEDGVQLLCLVGRGAEACRHLQDHSRWTDAAWLAKVVLNDQEAAAILRRWVDHLVAAGRKAKVSLTPHSPDSMWERCR